MCLQNMPQLIKIEAPVDDLILCHLMAISPRAIIVSWVATISAGMCMYMLVYQVQS